VPNQFSSAPTAQLWNKDMEPAESSKPAIGYPDSSNLAKADAFARFE
jgi:hypothetical protein